MSDCIFYVYTHLRATDNSVFYVGKGKNGRAYSKSGRSDHWRNTVKKHGYIVSFVKTGITEIEAYELEESEIKRLRSINAKICNVANGGEGGLSGTILTDDHKNKLRKAKLGKKQMPEHAIKSAMAKVGKKQPREAVERTRKARSKKIINSDGEIFPSASEAARLLSERIGSRCSQGNISMVACGLRGEAYGFSWSYDTLSVPKLVKKVIRCSNGMKFNSVVEAAKWVSSWRGSCAPSGITNSIFGGKKSYGLIWTYEELEP